MIREQSHFFAAKRPNAAFRAILALIAGLVLAAAGTRAAHAEPVSTIRLMLHPYAAAKGDLPVEQLARLEALAGIKLTLVGTTRTGALEFALPAPRDASEIAPVLRRLREDRLVLWAEAPLPRPTLQKSLQVAAHRRRVPGSWFGSRPASQPTGPCSLHGSPNAWACAVAPERQIGSVWVLRLMAAQTGTKLAELAELLQADPAVQYADPVLRKYARAIPNDPYYPQQWGLSDPVAGVNAASAWTLQTGSPGITVAVVDTGILSHPDLDGRVLAGYDFISDADRARDGDARDPNPRDEGDWIDEGGCGGLPAQDSSFHGLFVSGIIGAATNNGVGIAGMDWSANLLPVRALGECGGTDDDILAGMLWASGVPIADVPPNPNPAKVINMSLGGYGSCPQSMQEAIDEALGQGAIVVVSAGNESSDVASYAPANCSGVITVGAHNRNGERAYYSNYGRRVDLSAPAGDGGTGEDSVVSIANDGTKTPGNSTYSDGVGTSFSAPYVSGTASLMLARNPLLTPGRVLSILQGTARDFPVGSTCRAGNVCGAGMLDAGVALASTVPGNLTPPPGAVTIVEYYNPELDHYFITGQAAEIEYLDLHLRDVFQRTGYIFYAYLDPLVRATVSASGVQVLCRWRSADQFALFHGECRRVPVRADPLARHLDPGGPGDVLHRGSRRQWHVP